MFKTAIVALILCAVMTTKVKASMEPIPSIYVSCEDTLQGHFECGKQIGQTFSSRIAKSIDNAVFAKAAYEKIRSSTDSQLQQVFNNLKSYAIKTYPLYVEELKGTAVGSNQPFDLVLVLNFAQELSMLTSQVIEPERCTDVFLPGMIAHNEDGMVEDLSTIYRVHMRTFDPKTETQWTISTASRTLLVFQVGVQAITHTFVGRRICCILQYLLLRMEMVLLRYLSVVTWLALRVLTMRLKDAHQTR